MGTFIHDEGGKEPSDEECEELFDIKKFHEECEEDERLSKLQWRQAEDLAKRTGKEASHCYGVLISVDWNMKRAMALLRAEK